MKLLAVDDDPMILELLLETLPRLGFSDVTGAHSAAQAMQIIARGDVAFDGFLFDIQMPEMTGIDLCHWLRGQAGYAQVPILMITAMSERSFIDQSFAAGATDYVTKPFNPAELRDRLEQAARLHLERRGPSVAVDAMPTNTQDVAVSGYEAARHTTFVHVPSFAFETPFNIAEVGGVLDLLALENYLLQLGRGGMMASTCFAFRVQDGAELFQRCSLDEYYYTMTDIAEVLCESLRGQDSFVAHAGSGGFICLSHGRDHPDLQNLGMTIRHRLDEMDLRFDNGRPMAVTLNASPMFHLGLRSGAAALEQLNHALDLAGPDALSQQTPTLHDPASEMKAELRQRWMTLLRHLRTRIMS